MRKTGFLYDVRYLLHETGPYHPEIPERLTAIYQGIEAGGLLPKLVRIEAQRSRRRWIETVHDGAYIDRFGDSCQAGKKIFEHPDNQMCPDTFETAFLAVGGILRTIDMVMAGEIDNAFCAVRPPGHHAERNHALGFCYFNNVAIAARYLQQQWHLDKVGIIDFDVHHGNGTQHIFEQDPSVYYYSIHEHPTFAFPGSGREFESGSGAGYGYTKNLPVLPGQGDAEYTALVEENLVKDFDRFKPEFMLVSAGFDGHKDDDMSDMNLTTPWYSWVMKRIMEIADAHCSGRIVSVLEGGYCLQRLPELARNHVAVLLGDDTM
ncbi:MAG: histone deacetylase [Desulfobacterales bacterium]